MTKQKNNKKEANSEKKIESFNNALEIYFKDINRIPIMGKEEEERIAKQAARGSKAAREKLVNANLRFVIMIAKKFQGKGLPLEDLIAEGNIGLINAVRNFDENKGNRLITYAVWWIRQAIIKAIHEKGRMIRLPSNKTKQLIKIEKSREVIQNENGSRKNPELTEIADYLNIAQDKAADLINISQDVISLDEPIVSSEKTLTIIDLIEDMEQNKSPVEDTIYAFLKEDVEKALNSLGEKDADIVRNRFGLGNNGNMTLKEIGDQLDMSRERVRQIEKRALMQLRQSSHYEKLEGYIA